MKILSGILQVGPKCNHKGLYKGKRAARELVREDKTVEDKLEQCN